MPSFKLFITVNYYYYYYLKNIITPHFKNCMNLYTCIGRYFAGNNNLKC